MKNRTPITPRQRAKLFEALGYIILTILFAWVTTPTADAEDNAKSVKEDETKERNPFIPYSWDATPVVEEPKVPSAKDLTVSPLSKDPLSTYRVVGLVVSPTQEIAVIKTKRNYDYFAHTGEILGSEGGTIESIGTDAVVVKVGDDSISLPVNNKIESGYDVQ